MTCARLRRVPLWAALPVGCLILAALAVLVYYLMREASFRDETYLIPAGYEGPVLILYNRPDGQSPRYEDKALVYDVPISGVLLVQWDIQNIRPTYWYVRGDGIRVQIRPSSKSNCNEAVADDPIVVCDLPVKMGTSTPRHRGFAVTHVSKGSAVIDAYFKLLGKEVP